MQLDPSIVAAASERISRKGLPVAAPSAAKDILTTLPADRLLRLTRYIDTKRVADDVSAYERAVGTNDLLGLSYFWAGLRAARSVARISIAALPGDRGGDATGFMIAPNILLTNHHVFKTAEGTGRARAQFAYEADATGNERLTTWFSFKPGGFYFASEALDYYMIELDPATQKGPDGLASFGWLRLNKELGKTDYGQFLSIIQHPGGQPKQIAIRENQLLPFEDAELFLTYRSDTFRGSSGSPVFNDYWDVVALHHSGKPAKDAQGHYIGHDDQPIVDRTPQEHEIKWLANEGARTSFVVNDFLARAPAGAARSVIERAMSGQLLPRVVSLMVV